LTDKHKQKIPPSSPQGMRKKNDLQKEPTQHLKVEKKELSKAEIEKKERMEK